MAVPQKSIVRLDELDMKFAEAVAKAGGEKINLCLQCGTCSASCPLGRLTPFRIRQLIRRAQLGFREKVLSNKDLWLCTTCYMCAHRCPRDANPMEILIGLRSLVVEEGMVPRTLGDALEGVYNYGNPWGMSRSKRSDWAQDLKVKYVSQGEKVDLLYFVCCAASYDSRAQEVARAMVKNLNATGIDFSILGNRENCCGNEVYSLGERGLFEELVDKNLGLFDQFGINNIVTTSPHCYNAFKNRYGRKDLRVQHYAQYFANLIDEGKVKFSGRIGKVVTYHDPCFLGRHNNIYEEPRKVIESIPGVRFVELNMSRGRSVCCEG
ncbi:MAG: (Fe-S)-binding protein, partial [Candidatus Bathyarchaeota archaeon]|nr:(Fe-S)-binding protein [Candidatus Bathyarchaeota archaeon]